MDHGNKKKMPGGGMMLLKKMPGGGMMKDKMMPHGGKHDMKHGGKHDMKHGGKHTMPMYAYGGKVFAVKGAMLKAILKDPKQAAIARRELGMK